MKKFGKLLMLTLMAATLVFTGCNKDDEEDPSVVYYPTINFMTNAGYVSGDITLEPGFEFLTGINASMNATSEEKLVKLKIQRVFNNNPVTVLDSTINVEVLAYDNFFTTQSVAGVEKWVFTVTDKAGVSKEISYNITTTIPVVHGDIYTYTAILMGGQENTTLGSFWSSVDNQVLKQDDAALVQNKVDFVYFYGTTNLATIASTADDQANVAWSNTFSTNWTTRNATKFKKLTGIDWAQVIDDELIVAEATNLTLTRANELTVGQIVAFETAATSANAGKKGFFKVMEITGTSGLDRTITIEVKIQK